MRPDVIHRGGFISTVRLLLSRKSPPSTVGVGDRAPVRDHEIKGKVRRAHPQTGARSHAKGEEEKRRKREAKRRAAETDDETRRKVSSGRSLSRAKLRTSRCNCKVDDLWIYFSPLHEMYAATRLMLRRLSAMCARNLRISLTKTTTLPTSEFLLYPAYPGENKILSRC